MNPLSAQKPRVIDVGPYQGLFRATVLDRKDPEKQGRIKVKMRHIYGDINADQIPWAYPMSGGAWKDDSGQFSGGGVGWIPTVGSPVYVMFEGGNPLYPIWMGGWWGNQDAPFQMPVYMYDEAGEPNNMFMAGPNGALLQIDGRSGSEKILLRMPNGDYISIGLDGITDIRSSDKVRVAAEATVTIESNTKVIVRTDNAVVYSSSDTKVEAGGNVSVKAGGNVDIDASRVSINSGNAQTVDGEDKTISTDSLQDGK